MYLQPAAQHSRPNLYSGPRPGWRLRGLSSPESTALEVKQDNQNGGPMLPHARPHLPSLGPEMAAAMAVDGHDDDTASPPASRQSSRARPRPPLLGLPTGLVDQLLAVYFTHVHVGAKLHDGKH